MLTGTRGADRPGRYFGTGCINAAENKIALPPGATYHGGMTTRQATKRGGCVNPAAQLAAARMSLGYGVVAV